MNLKSVLSWHLLLTSLPALSAAAQLREGICLQACKKCFKPVPFAEPSHNNDAPAAADATLSNAVPQSCQNRLAFSSMYLCLDLYCITPQDRDASLQSLNATCLEKFHVAIPGFDLVANYTAGDVSLLRRFTRNETFSKNEPVGEVILPTGEYYALWFDTLDSVAYVHKYHFLYGFSMIFFWVIIVAIGMVNRIAISASRLLTSKISPHSFPNNCIDPPSTWFRRKIIVPATFGYRCAQNVWWCTIPPRIQTLTLLAFTAINIAFSILGYRIIPENIYFPSTTKQILRYVSDRTGIISFANFPIIWLFGMRNNFALWLTGWDFGTYNNFHRWVARIATLQAVVHSIGYTVLIFREGGWKYFAWWWQYWFWWAGELATVFMCLLVGLSVYWIRRTQYETFLIIHIGLSLLILLTMLGHVSIFNGQFDGLFWVPVYIWVADRTFRIIRILAFNYRITGTTALATYNESSNIVRLRIPSHRSVYKPAPGTYYYLMVLNNSHWWESHPFTVASVSNCSTQRLKSFGEELPLLVSNDENGTQGAEDSPTSPRTDSNWMTFLIRPYDGFTSRLRDQAASDWPQSTPIRVLVEGPYGHTLPFHTFNRVLFVVGGSGIVLPLSYITDLASTTSKVKSIHIHWAVREPALAADVLERDFGEILERSNVSLDLYITSQTGCEVESTVLSQVQYHSGRLDAREVVTLAAAAAGAESLAVVACGPAKMADDSRRAVVDMMGRGSHRIEYFEESFNW